MFLGWYDPNKKTTTAAKVNDAVRRYVEKFGSDPLLCLTSATDAEELRGKTNMTVRAVSYIGRYTYYVGVEEASGLDARSERTATRPLVELVQR